MGRPGHKYGPALALALALWPNTADADNVRVAYDTCVYYTFESQRKITPQISKSVLAEMAFAACTTEEMRLSAVFGLTMDPNQVQMLISSIRSQLKRRMLAG